MGREKYYAENCIWIGSIAPEEWGESYSGQRGQLLYYWPNCLDFFTELQNRWRETLCPKPQIDRANRA